MTHNWEPIALRDVLEIKHGWPFKSELFCEELTGKPIVVAVGNFQYTGGFRFNSTTTKEYLGEYPKEYELKPGDILLVMTCQTEGGEILGIPARVPDDGRTYLHNQRLGKVVIKRSDLIRHDFIYWVFLWKDFNEELVASSSGTKIKHTAPTRIEQFRLALPPPSEQQAIARVLGALEDRIELNRRLIRTLEETAAALFRSWFVDFDPVVARAAGRKPAHLRPDVAALFPANFQDSEMGEIPTGWNVVPVSDISESIFSGGTPHTQTPDFWNGELPWLSSGETRDPFIISTEKKITTAGVENSSTRFARKGATVIAGAGQGHTRGQTSLLLLDTYINQSVVVAVADRKAASDLFLYFDLSRRYEEFRQLSDAHSSRGSLTTKLIGTAKAIVPPFEFITKFDAVVGPLIAQIEASLRESSTIAALRDTLLPKVLSGELRVKSAEKLVEAAA